MSPRTTGGWHIEDFAFLLALAIYVLSALYVIRGAALSSVTGWVIAATGLVLFAYYKVTR